MEFDRLKELSPGMSPTRRVHKLGSTEMVVSPVPITLQDSFEVAQEPFGTFPFPTHPEVEDHRSSRPAVLPEVGQMIFSSPIVHLHAHRGFVGLDIITL